MKLDDRELCMEFFSIFEETYKEGPLESYEQFRERILAKVSFQLKGLIDEFTEGLLILFNLLNTPQFFKEKEKLKLPALEDLMETFHRNISLENAGYSTIQEAMGINDESLACLFRAACLLLEKQDRDAVKAFKTLVILNPNISFFWLGYGESLRLANLLTEAIDVYSVSLSINPLDPTAYSKIGLITINHKDFDITRRLIGIGQKAIESAQKDESTEPLEKVLAELTRLAA